MIVVDFKYNVILDEIEAKITRMLITFDVIAIHINSWMFLVRNDLLNFHVLSILWLAFEHMLKFFLFVSSILKSRSCTWVSSDLISLEIEILVAKIISTMIFRSSSLILATKSIIVKAAQ